MKASHALVLAAGILVIGASALGVRYAVREHARRLEEQREQRVEKEAEAIRQAQREAEAQRKRRAEEKAREIQKALGDEIRAQLGYHFVNESSPHHFENPYIPYLGYDIENLRVFINRETGTLTITFDCQFAKDAPRGRNMLVRLFDANGQYLTHFITAERFSPFCENADLSMEKFLDNIGQPHAERKTAYPCENIVLKQEGNALQYVINTRDAVYAQEAEFGPY